MLIVPEIHSHRSLSAAVTAERGSAEHAYVGERSIVIVAVKVVRRGIVGHIQIRPAVIVIVAPHRPEAVIQVGVVHARLLGNILKSSVSTIAKEKMALSNHSPGAALHGNALEMAKLSAAEFRKMIHIDMHVTGDEQIHVAVTVVVSPGCPGAEASHAYSGLFRHIFKCAVALVVVEHVAAVTGYIEVQNPVVIKI